MGVNPEQTTAAWMKQPTGLPHKTFFLAPGTCAGLCGAVQPGEAGPGQQGYTIATCRLLNGCICTAVEKDLYLEELYYQFGRYLLIASSRPGNLPANLQGIWHNNVDGPWRVDYHNNINLQMNYWPACLPI